MILLVHPQFCVSFSQAVDGMSSDPESLQQIPAHLLAVLAEAVFAYGGESVALALRNANLFVGVRALSRLSLSTSAACVAEGFAATLVIKLNPRAKSLGERVEIRVITGDEIGLTGT